MVKYEKCPRCDLNYIDPEKQEYCDVCLAEIKGTKLQFADLDEEELLQEEMEEERELCAECGVNSVRNGEKYCESCLSSRVFDVEEEELDPENDEEWKNYLDEEDDDGDLTVDDAVLAEELDSEEEETEDEFESEDVDSLSDLEDDEYDDDFDDDDDDDDDEF